MRVLFMGEVKTELVVIDKAYHLLIWCSERIAKFPRSHRFTVGQRLEGRMAQVLEGLLRAKYSRERVPRADLAADRAGRWPLRFLCLGRRSWGVS
jgi:hypothetical protein